MTELDCDVAVIGAGTAGLAAERHARQAGARTVIIDPAWAGTTCALVGCMPSKLLIAAGGAAHAVSSAARFGIEATPMIHGEAVMQRVQRLRDDFVNSTRKSFDDIPESARIAATARFTGPNTLSLSDGRQVRAKAIVIATGAKTIIPKGFDGLGDRLLTNETVFDLKDLPASLAVIGAGPQGMELAQAFARLGVRVEVFDKGGSVAGLQGDDADSFVAMLEPSIPVHLNVDVSAEAGDEVTIRAGDHEARFSHVLVSAGRAPALGGLDLTAAGLEVDDHGTPLFDKQTMQCGRAPIFIAGDANHDRAVLHEATSEGSVAGANAAAFPDVRRSRRKVPLAIAFTHPQVAQIGTPPEGDDSRVAEASWSDQGRARVDGHAHGFARLHSDGEGRICAATLCMPDAEHLAHYFALAITAGMTAGDLLDQPIYHPTLEEGVKKALQGICAACALKVPWDRGTGFQPGD
ncbi:dihydrolipoyl dehydrogenase [Falsirhodobacter algicola]|uniref:Dihydrolipoyl dehydrogenase n=1 Tax=Falsirhodobacter algicola TaxID=2692330 RepID=A0A8J8SJW8_9RHOB|nr:dihydrolipoyl dehydrogenase [Falsirhodobacter algicola]QUS35260.1 dihydrolipoyl dehydrogenase [Falsirhodobacter algicola]